MNSTNNENRNQTTYNTQHQQWLNNCIQQIMKTVSTISNDSEDAPGRPQQILK